MDFLTLLYNVSPWLAVIVAVAIVSWWASKYHQKLEDTNKKVSELPCAARLDELNKLTSSSEKLDDMSISIRKIEEWLIKSNASAIDNLVRKCSPYALTEAGNILLVQSAAKACIDDNIDLLISNLKDINPQTPFDVEKNALTVISNISDTPMFNAIKGFLYNVPSEIIITTPSDNSEVKVNITMPRLLMIMSVYLRDKYFEVHPEIDLTEFGDKKEGN